MEKFKIVACCSPPACCPTLTVEENIDGIDYISITDDFNGHVIVSTEEFELLAKAFLFRNDIELDPWR